MKVAIHQPNYLPWIGFFDKLDHVDIFVILDRAMYSKRGFINRNKIKTPEGELLLTVPITDKNKPIHDIRIVQTTNWQRRHWKAIESNYKKSKYWKMYYASFEKIYHTEWEKLSHLNIALINHINKLLNINTKVVLESELNSDFGRGNMRNVNIVKYMKGTVYLSGVGARAYNKKSEFIAHDISLQYQQFIHPIYEQRFGSFVSNLSMIDMIFNCGPETINMIRTLRK